jgi:hypothetical protein
MAAPVSTLTIRGSRRAGKLRIAAPGVTPATPDLPYVERISVVALRT